MRSVAFAALVSVLAAACGSAAAGPPAVTGYVTHVQPGSGDTIASVRIEEEPRDTSGSAKLVLRITRATVIVDGAATHDVAAITVGRRVRAWVTGPIADSYPGQGTASRIELIIGP